MERLRRMRETGERSSREAVELGAGIVEKGSGLDPEYWVVCEQVFDAAADCGEWALAERTLGLLRKRFPESQTVWLLSGKLCEAKGELGAARDIYQQVVSKDPSNLAAHKRGVALRRAAGDLAGAVQEMCELLKVWAADVELWMELADVYCTLQQYRQAAFCYEEVLAASPLEFHVWARCAEAHYSAREFVMARKYFSRAAELAGPDSPSACRALLGVCMSCFSAGKGAGKKESEVNKQLHAWAAKKLENRMPLCQPMLRRQSAAL